MRVVVRKFVPFTHGLCDFVGVRNYFASGLLEVVLVVLACAGLFWGCCWPKSSRKLVALAVEEMHSSVFALML